MAILTEDAVRKLMKTTEMQETKVVEVEKGTIITPSARSFLSDHQIKLYEIPECVMKKELTPLNEEELTQASQTMATPFLYKTLTGGQFIEKPIYMSVLKENIIAPNDHPMIKLRGQVDRINGEILNIQWLANEAGFADLIEELALVASCSQNLFFNDISLPSELIHQIEDVPATCQVQYQMGPVVIALNQLRLHFEHTSLMAYESLKAADGTIKEIGLLEKLNDLALFCQKLLDNVNKGKYKKK